MKQLLFICSILFSVNLLSQTSIYTDENDDGIIEYSLKSENGKVIETGYFLNWKMHGTWTSYYESGKVHTVAKFRNGLRQGKWRFYDDKGRLTLIVTFDKNRKIMATENKYASF